MSMLCCTTRLGTAGAMLRSGVTLRDDPLPRQASSNFLDLHDRFSWLESSEVVAAVVEWPLQAAGREGHATARVAVDLTRPTDRTSIVPRDAAAGGLRQQGRSQRDQGTQAARSMWLGSSHTGRPHIVRALGSWLPHAWVINGVWLGQNEQLHLGTFRRCTLEGYVVQKILCLGYATR